MAVRKKVVKKEAAKQRAPNEIDQVVELNLGILAELRGATALEKIKDETEYEEVVSVVATAQGVLKEIEEARTRITKPLLQAKREVDAQARKAGDFSKKVVAHGKGLMADYLAGQRRAALKAAEKKAAKLEKSGDHGRALAVIQDAAEAEVVPAYEGVAFRDKWIVEVTDVAALLHAVIEGQAPPECIMVNEKFLGALAREKKSEDLGIPGVRGVKDTTVAVAG